MPNNNLSVERKANINAPHSYFIALQSVMKQIRISDNENAIKNIVSQNQLEFKSSIRRFWTYKTLKNPHGRV